MHTHVRTHARTHACVHTHTHTPDAAPTIQHHPTYRKCPQQQGPVRRILIDLRDVAEAQVVKIQKIVANMTECDQQGLHHGADGVCTRSDSWSCSKLTVTNGASSIKREAFIGTIARVTCDDGSYNSGGETLTCLGKSTA